MAEFACADCSFEAHFSDFKTGSRIEFMDGDDGFQDAVEVDDCECPLCGSDAVYEL